MMCFFFFQVHAGARRSLRFHLRHTTLLDCSVEELLFVGVSLFQTVAFEKVGPASARQEKHVSPGLKHSMHA
jgi:hypothetical protein